MIEVYTEALVGGLGPLFVLLERTSPTVIRKVCRACGLRFNPDLASQLPSCPLMPETDTHTCLKQINMAEIPIEPQRETESGLD